jgi:pantetheine-phosphate adenylyltransferase
MTERRALYPGTFDPITYGHMDIVSRALRIFDHLTLAVADGGRSTLLDVEQRVTLAIDAVSKLDPDGRVDVVSFSGLLVDTMREVDADVVVRGLRTPGDMEHEQTMAAMNRSLDPDFEVVVFFARAELSLISGTLVRDVARCNGPVERFVPDAAAAALREHFTAER